MSNSHAEIPEKVNFSKHICQTNMLEVLRKIYAVSMGVGSIIIDHFRI